MQRTSRAELPDVLALGAWMKNAACRLHAGVPTFSSNHGDLAQPHACLALEASAHRLLDGGVPRVAAIAHDLHPDFFSTRLALRLAGERGVPAIAVQHHHAHIAAVMAEYDVRGPVIGLALDGVGLGTDGRAWGGELLRVDARGAARLGHLRPLALPGGDVAAREPWRMAAAVLHALGRTDDIEPRFAAMVGSALARGVSELLRRGLRCPPTSSAGRWFDAAAGLLGLSVRQTRDAEAAVALEQRAARCLGDGFEPADVRRARPSNDGMLDLLPLMARLVSVPTGRVDEAAAWFHVALANALADWCEEAAQRCDLGTVCLGGGCFFNAVLTDRLSAQLRARGLRVLRAARHSCGDAGLALGQAWATSLALSGAPIPALNGSLSCV